MVILCTDENPPADYVGQNKFRARVSFRLRRAREMISVSWKRRYCRYDFAVVVRTNGCSFIL